MKKTTSRIICYSLVAALLPVFAIAIKATAASSTLTAPPDPSKGTTLTDRMTKRQEAYKAQLANLSTQKVSSACRSVQAKLETLKTKRLSSNAKREAIYTKLATQLATITENLGRQRVSSDVLSESQREIIGAINVYLEDFQKFKVALDDAIKVDCRANQAGFQASLLEVRQLNSELAADIAAIKAKVPELANSLSAIKLNLLKEGN